MAFLFVDMNSSHSFVYALAPSFFPSFPYLYAAFTSHTSILCPSPYVLCCSFFL